MKTRKPNNASKQTRARGEGFVRAQRLARPLRCDVCGRYVDASDPSTTHVMTQPDCAFGGEEWETLCADHRERPSDQAHLPAPAEMVERTKTNL